MHDKFTVKAKTTGICVICGQSFAVGADLTMRNLGDDTNKNWIVSPHPECYAKLEANPELKKQSQFVKKSRSPEERFQDAVSAVDKLWTVAHTKADTIIGTIYKDGSNGNQYFDIRKEKLIFAEVYLKALVEVYSR